MPEPVTVPPAPPPGTFEAVPTTSVPLPTSTTSAHDLLGLVLAHAELRPDSPALQDDHGRFTYGELARHVANLASGLSALGVGAGDRVGLYLPNSADFVSLALSCLWLGRCGCLFRSTALHRAWPR